MFARNSRYYDVPISTVKVTDSSGVTSDVRYVLRRFIGRVRPATLAQYRVRSGDRLDNVTARFFNDPTQFWRIADMNRATQADDVCARTGRTIDIPAVTR
jgi:hypothetical protein